jgi:hypothetical protein
MPRSGIELPTLDLEENCSHNLKFDSKMKLLKIKMNKLNSYNFFNESEDKVLILTKFYLKIDKQVW